MPLTWITFSGSPQESLASFVQSIQRIAFQQNRLRDDRWITDYVSTCFDGKALYWFVELDDEIQGSWKQLRLALIRRFPLPPDSGDPNSGTPPTSSPSDTMPISVPLIQSTTVNRMGRIEVVGPYAVSLGYLEFNASHGISITPSEQKGSIVRFPDPTSWSPCHIELVGKLSFLPSLTFRPSFLTRTYS